MESKEGSFFIEENRIEKDMNIDLMKKLFSENTTISREKKGKYQVNTILDEGVCDGGQEVKLDLVVSKVVSKPIIVKKYDVIEPYINFRVKSFVVNNQEIIDDHMLVYLNGERSPKLNMNLFPEAVRKMHEQQMQINKNQCFLDEENDASANIKLKVIELRKIKSGDDIAKYFHEIGHIVRGKNDLKIGEILKIRGDLPKKIKGNKDTFDKRAMMYRKAIYEERMASLKGLALLKEVKGLFPNDSKLLKVQQIHLKALLICVNGYYGMDKKLIESVENEMDKIMDLDQNWHF